MTVKKKVKLNSKKKRKLRERAEREKNALAKAKGGGGGGEEEEEKSNGVELAGTPLTLYVTQLPFSASKEEVEAHFAARCVGRVCEGGEGV